MEGLNSNQKQKLIDFKNKLIEEANMHYDYASIEDNKIEETKQLALSNSKMNIVKIIEDIIYNG